MNAQSPPDNERPPLQVNQGRYFRWSMPPDWQANETISGVDLGSPDGLTRATSTIIRNSFGFPTPTNFLMQALPSAPGITGLRCLSTTRVADQPAGFLRSLKVEEVELAFQYFGHLSRGTCVCAISSGFGAYDALVVGYHSLADRFDRERLWLARIAQSVTITDPRSVAGNDQVILPKNQPLDNSALIASWRRKGISDDQISKAQREATMGYKRLKDTETGTIHEMPLEAYDGTIGGYRNPVRPTEILANTIPGE
jgi:hypothetical protein